LTVKPATFQKVVSEVVYIFQKILSYVSAGNRSLNGLNL